METLSKSLQTAAVSTHSISPPTAPYTREIKNCPRISNTRLAKTVKMLGRSDGVLKPAGVRFGSAEIYNILTRFFASEIEDSVCVGRRRPGVDADETVCLFVVMAAGKKFVRGDTDARLRDVIRRQLSPRHVPAVVEECGPAGVPKTGNGKKIEVAVKQILSGMEVKTNASVANPEALAWFKTWAEENP